MSDYDEGYRAGMQKMREVGQRRIEELEANAMANRVAIMRLEAKLAKAREEGFWAGRSCGGSKKEIDAALAELKGQDDE